MTKRQSLFVPALMAWALSCAQAQTEAPARFTVGEYRVLGNTTLTGTKIEAALYPLLGDDKTIDDVEQARKTLEAVYRDGGYGAVFVDIPEQDVTEGIVRLKVTEGRLDRVRVTGARYFSNGKLLAELPALRHGASVQLADVQTQLMQANQKTRDRQVTPVLRAGRVPGAVDMELKVKDDVPFHGSVDVNDRYTANTTRTRASFGISYDNLFQRYQSLSLQYQTAPEERDQVRVFVGSYVAPLGSSGNVLAAYAVDTNSSFSGVGGAGDFSVLGAGRIYGLRYIVRLAGAPGVQTVSFGVDDKDFRDDISLTGGAMDTTPIHYTAWQVAWGANWQTPRTASALNVSANFGIRGIGNNEEEFEFKRYRAKPNFMYLRADAQHERPLFGGATIFGRVQGQSAVDPLISNEQFAIGGADSVRGYLESARLGDMGANASVELRSPSLHKWSGGFLNSLVLFGFYDAGIVGILDPLPDENDQLIHRMGLRSTGAGLRFTARGGLTGALDWGYPLRTIEQTAQGDSRIHFSIRAAW